MKQLGDKKRALSCPAKIAEPSRKKKDSSSFLARTQPMKSHGWTLCLLYLLQLLFPPIKEVFPCHVGTCIWFSKTADP